MSKGNSGLFSNTIGSKAASESNKLGNATKATPLFSSTGHVSKGSISANRELFFGKSVTQIDGMLREQRYQTTIRKSKHESSSAKIIVTTNSDRTADKTIVFVENI